MEALVLIMLAVFAIPLMVGILGIVFGLVGGLLGCMVRLVILPFGILLALALGLGHLIIPIFLIWLGFSMLFPGES